MTDGNPTEEKSEYEPLEEDLKNLYGVNSFYIVAYNSGVLNMNHLNSLADMYKPNSAIIRADASNLTEAFRDILYKVNASTPELAETIDGRLDISDIEVSANKPMSVVVTKNGTNINTITITEYPTASEGIIIIDGGRMYLSVDALKEACGLDNFDGVQVSIEYYSI